ncbi:hypothetical protein L2E82_40157 [Cichorium intybus]|uniref:Uncharacterized protein n=1 Tax=Cichorium intybus TaxID=13427 RepID=A0ACB9AJJ2_CICIN|nr:hypothetical protein L2E82_40157 [Cichorium intybus]
MFIFFLFYLFLSEASDTLTSLQPLTINQTLVSNGEVFELGFFDPGNNNLYIGIWYKQIQPITYVWVANRDTPITSSSGNLTIVDNGNIALVNQTGSVFWSSNQSTTVVKTVAQLLDNGNFVLRPENDENPENYIWQSFDYPTDTLLPEMKLGWDRKSGINRFLRSWKTNDDPATGDYAFKLDIRGFPELVTFINETIHWRTGPWNGIRFSGVPQMKGVDFMRFELQENSDEISYSYEMLNSSLYSRLVINSSGVNQRFVWYEQPKYWNEFWSFPDDDSCDKFGYAGSEDGGQDLYVRVAASYLGQSQITESSKNRSGNGNQVGRVVGISVGACVLLILLMILVYFKMKRAKSPENSMDREGPQGRTDDFLVNNGVIIPSRRDYHGETTMDELELPLFDFATLAIATNNFSDRNKLGQGGFGCVYKGILTEGEVVAVKRLSRVCEQGIEELKNEVRLIAKLQHRNLVRVIGCCIEVEEKLLIYEFMENKSLDTFLFEKEKSMKLNWKIRLEIIRGIARGLLYLHQDSRFKIIHRDMKASNILLDKEMNPKISDFGIARIFGSDQTEAETKIVVGTYGYMSPEYMMNGYFSTNSDVFSFGVLLLEIVSGKRNRGSSNTNSQLNLLSQAWKLWNEGNPLKLLDESIGTKYSENEVLRCIQIGLLCVEEQPEGRPTMSKVMLLLSSETVRMPRPKHPGFFISKGHLETVTPSKQDDSMTMNQITLTILDGR